MFGFARVRPEMLAQQEYHDLRRNYCGLCAALRRDYGLPYAALTGWDGRFIALLVGAQLPDADPHARTRCPARLGVQSRSAVPYGSATRYAAAVTVYLLGEKLDDDLMDEGSWRARLAKPLTRRQVDHAADVLVDLGFPIANAISLREAQRSVESGNGTHSLDAVTQPPAEATALILGHTAVLTGMPENGPALREIGRSVGRIVTLLDACDDFARDAASGRFNAVAAMADHHESAQVVSAAHYDQTADYLHEQLRTIRRMYSNLVLRSFTSLLRNILFMGLYDAMTDATGHLALCVSDPLQSRKYAWWCPACGAQVSSRFCPSCGQSPYNINEGKEDQ